MLGFVACKQISSYRFWASAMSFTTYCIPDTFAEKQDMDPILKQQLLAFILGGSFLSTITGFVTLKYTKKQAEAKALSSVQDVYQELIADLRADKEAMKKDKVESETRWTIRIEKLEISNRRIKR